MLVELLPLLRSMGFAARARYSENLVTLRFRGRENRFYLFGGRDESSAALIQGMTLGGILEGTGALGVVVDRMTRSVTSPGGLILATLVSCYLMTIGTGNGMLSIIVPARAFEKKFRDMGIQSRVLSRTLEDAVTLGIALVPYSMAAFFIVGVLKIDAMQYIPYAFVNWIVPIFSLTYGFTGFAIWKINKDAGNSPAESEA